MNKRKVKRPRNLPVDDGKYFECESDLDIKMIYFVENRCFHWIVGKRKIKALHAWLGRAIQYLEQEEPK